MLYNKGRKEQDGIATGSLKIFFVKKLFRISKELPATMTEDFGFP
jgi:hypothetical protein